ETAEKTAKQFSWSGGEFKKDLGVIKVLKVDSYGETITFAEATFELYRVVNDEEVLMGEYTTENGILEISNLNLGTYVLKETAAPDGYRLSEEKLTVEVDKVYGEEKYIVEKEFKNISDVVISIPVEKKWNDEENQDGNRTSSI